MVPRSAPTPTSLLSDADLSLKMNLPCEQAPAETTVQVSVVSAPALPAAGSAAPSAGEGDGDTIMEEGEAAEAEGGPPAAHVTEVSVTYLLKT